jgi:hypothetical protein
VVARRAGRRIARCIVPVVARFARRLVARIPSRAGSTRWPCRSFGVGSGSGTCDGLGRRRLEVWIGVRGNIRSRAATRLAAPATG